MRVGFSAEHYSDQAGNPAGGKTTAIGFEIDWQNGPLVDPETGERREQSGAIDHLEMALENLRQRTAEREARGVEGTHRV